jgi:serine protease AprX
MNLNNYLKTSFFVGILLLSLIGKSQNAWVYFNDKESNTDYFNTEVSEIYIQQLKNAGIAVKGSSRWLNAACVESKDLELLKGFSFVSYVEPLGKYFVSQEQITEDFGYGEGDWQIEMLNLDSFHRQGITGKGINLALFDAGFYMVDSFEWFKSLWDSNQIVAYYDFVTKDTMTWRTHTHGMQVLALAGATYNDSMVGAAPGANFILARTEESGRERHIEEFNWLNAMEWADSIGVDIIHSSLGYSLFDTLEGDYTYADMDGNSTIITLSAELAASRGIFITNSAGNSGNRPWHYITAPCDGRNVLCVGAVDSMEVITGFSSRGPSSDGRIKPDVSAMGRRNTIPNSRGLLSRGSGTSFSGPLVAGLVACLMEANPSRSNDQIFNAILESCDRYTTPDNDYGYGIPDVVKADSILKSTVLLKSIEKPLEVKVYPNPVTSYTKVVCNPNSNYLLYNSGGQVIKQGSLNNWVNFIDFQDVSHGIYHLKVRYQEKQTTLQIIK